MANPIFKHQVNRRDTSLRNYYYREGDERFYRRIWGGICQPGERPEL